MCQEVLKFLRFSPPNTRPQAVDVVALGYADTLALERFGLDFHREFTIKWWGDASDSSALQISKWMTKICRADEFQRVLWSAKHRIYPRNAHHLPLPNELSQPLKFRCAKTKNFHEPDYHLGFNCYHHVPCHIGSYRIISELSKYRHHPSLQNPPWLAASVGSTALFRYAHRVRFVFGVARRNDAGLEILQNLGHADIRRHAMDMFNNM